ncbi:MULTISPECIES: type III secretion system gatekeeper subunit SctW [Pantoea]|uniref:type III secretion system gatekeeper subunit SctW n=1 Tax=Pantoea TaxID=53335 RepID=UPI001B30DB6A|nr:MULTISPECIES: type III secretion system gatekeeper subunit SctW [Pantoea]WRH15808.1 YopN family type III secretion system gatekeeper subunit [Pantoea sp. JZ2]
MDIRSVAGVDFNRIEPQIPENRSAAGQPVFDVGEKALLINLQEEMSNAAEEMADLLSAFGRFSKAGRKNDSVDNDFVSSMLEDLADEKLDTLIKHVTQLRDLNNLLNFARQLFPDDNDLMLALREMLLSRQLSELQKKKIKEAIADLEKFGDTKKMQSGMNVGRLAKRFSDGSGDRPLSAKDLRNSYLNFLELEMPAGFIYKDWIDVYGYQNRTRLLAFTLSALIADMKANEPGIHSSEFGPLSAKLSDARLLHTLDQLLNESFAKFPFRGQMRHNQLMLGESDIVGLYIAGLVDTDEFKLALKEFSKNFMSLLLLKQRSMVIQELRNVYNMTPEFLFVDTLYWEVIVNHLAALLHKMLEKEKNTGIWNEYYK